MAGCGRRDAATIAPIPHLHRGGSMGWEGLEQFATVSRSETASICIFLSLSHTRESSGWLGSQVPRRKMSGQRQGSVTGATLSPTVPAGSPYGA